MSKGPNANQYSIGLDILNLTSDAKIIIDIRNEVGNLKHEKIISYIPTPKLTIYTTRMYCNYYQLGNFKRKNS